MSQPTFTLTSSCTTSFYLPYPEWGSPDNHIRKSIKLFNMWTESDIETKDYGIDTQTLVIGGTICIESHWEGVCMPICPDALCFSEALSTWLDNLKDAMNNGCEFTINELGDCLNGVYIIKRFNFDTINRVAHCFKWKLELERVEDII